MVTLEKVRSAYLREIKSDVVQLRHDEIFRTLNRFLQVMGNVEIIQVTKPGLVKDAILSIKSEFKLSDSSIYYTAGIIKTFLNYCIKVELLPKDTDTFLLTNFREFQKKHYSFFKNNSVVAIYPFEEEEMRYAWLSQDGNLENLRNAIIINILFDTGISVSELVSLRRDDYHNGVLKVKRYGRHVSISDSTEKLLEEYLSQRKDTNPYLLIIETNVSLVGVNRRTIERITHKTSKIFGNQFTITPNKIRQSKTAKLFAEGLSRKDVSVIMGYNFYSPQLSKFSSIDGSELNSQPDKNVNRFLEDFSKISPLKSTYKLTAKETHSLYGASEVDAKYVSHVVFLRESDVIVFLNKIKLIYKDLIPAVFRMKEWKFSRDLFKKLAKIDQDNVKTINGILYVKENLTKSQMLAKLKS